MSTRRRGGAKRVTTLSSRGVDQEECRRLAGPVSSVIELLALPGAEDIEFAPPRVGRLYRSENSGRARARTR